ncbi:MAG: hypothetical protein ACFWTJ_11510 [Lachnoclostridium sp.]|jgi:hypothetical protein
MMRFKAKQFLLMVGLSVLLIGAFAACNGKEKQKEAASYTITFMNGDTTLGTATVKENETLSPDDYSSYESIPDTEFLGWFETPTFLESSKKDLTTATFSKDTTLYGNFKSTKVTKDERVWYIAGSSDKGPLKQNNWAGDVSDEIKEQFELKPTGNGTNEFAITIDLFAGDQFQIIHDWAWDGQKGYGCFTAIDETQMENGGGLGGSADTANVNVIMDGNYTITLTTDPDNPVQDTLAIVRNGDPLTKPEEEEETPFIPTQNTGVSVKGSWVDDWSDLKELTRKDGTNEFTITLDLAKDTELCFVITENGEDTGIVLKEENVKDEASKALLAKTGNNIKIAADGSYTFAVDAGDQTVTITKEK